MVADSRLAVNQMTRLKYSSRRSQLTLAGIAWGSCLVASAACRSLPAREEPADSEVLLARADSEVFAAVVRAQLAGRDNQYPSHLDRLRYDPRPYGTASGYPEVFAGVQGIDPTLSFSRAEQPVIDGLVENRKRILQINDIPEGR